MKKLFTLVLVVVMVFSTFSVVANAQVINEQTSCDDILFNENYSNISTQDRVEASQDNLEIINKITDPSILNELVEEGAISLGKMANCLSM